MLFGSFYIESFMTTQQSLTLKPPPLPMHAENDEFLCVFCVMLCRYLLQSI